VSAVAVRWACHGSAYVGVPAPRHLDQHGRRGRRRTRGSTRDRRSRDWVAAEIQRRDAGYGWWSRPSGPMHAPCSATTAAVGGWTGRTSTAAVALAARSSRRVGSNSPRRSQRTRRIRGRLVGQVVQQGVCRSAVLSGQSGAAVRPAITTAL